MAAWVLWDGDCGLCASSAAWLRRQDRSGALRVEPYQSAPSPPMTPELRESCRLAVHVVADGGRVLRGGRASIFILRALGWPVAFLALPPFVWLVELAYRLVARNRSHIACRLPSS